MADRHVYAAILAGGSGQRFWPLSRELSPKQLLSVFGAESLIAQAVHRVAGVVDDGNVLLVTNERLFDELRNHLTAHEDVALHRVRYLQEPLPRNTAAAIAYAAAVLEAEDPEAIMVVLPSDHTLESGTTWEECLAAAIGAAREGFFVTIGIAPTRPDTGYGYIKAAPEQAANAVGNAVPRVAERFVEKPDAIRAEEYVRSGEYVWNAGIFVMGATRVLDEMARFPDVAPIAQTARWLARVQADGSCDPAEARARFERLPAVSIDVAVMERSDRVAVIPAPLRWSDVGSLLALEEVAPSDADGNVRVGRGVDVGSRDTVVYSTDRLVATLGLGDMLVVDTADATLVLPKDRAQDVRLVVEALSALGAEEVARPKVSLRPWGSWTALMHGDGFQIKLIEVKPGCKLSLQRHEHRAEHWVVVEGEATVTRDGQALSLALNESVHIPAGSVHRLENTGTGALKVIEVAVGTYLGEDDIVRLDDDWERHA